MVRGPRYRILMLSPNFPPLSSPESFVNGKLALSFLNVGWEVSVVSISNLQNLFREDNSLIWDSLKPKTYPAIGFGPNHLTKIIGKRLSFEGAWAVSAAQLALELTRKEPFDVILSRSLTVLAHLPALILSQKTGLAWIANWNDPAPAHRCPEPYGRGAHACAPLHWNIYHHFVSAKAGWHTFPCERLMRYMKMLHPRMNGKTSVIPHVALSGLSNHSSSETSQKFTLCHAGEILQPRNPDFFLEGLRRLILKYRMANTKLLLLGTRAWNRDDLRIPQELGDIIEFRGWCNYIDSLKTMATSSVNIVIEAQMVEGIFLPSKFVDYLQCGRPLLAISPKEGTLSELINRYGGGIAADCTSPDEIAAAIEKLYLSWKTGRLEQEYSVERLKRVFSEETIIGQYQELFDRLEVKGI